MSENGTTSWDESDGTLTVKVETSEECQTLTGDTSERSVVAVEFRMPADEGLALEVSNALRDFYCSEQPSGPPGHKPMHQKYAEMEPEP